MATTLASQKWVDLGAHSGPEYTYGASATWDKFSTGTGVTRPDLILANQPRARYLHQFSFKQGSYTKEPLGTLNSHQIWQLYRTVCYSYATAIFSLQKII